MPSISSMPPPKTTIKTNDVNKNNKAGDTTTTKTPPPVTTSTLLNGGGSDIQPDVRQILSQILVILQSLMSKLSAGQTMNTNIGTLGADATGNGLICPSLGANGGIQQPANSIVFNPTISQQTLPQPTSTLPNNLGFGGFSGVSNLNISSLPPAMQLNAAPTNFFTPVMLPNQQPTVTTTQPTLTTQQQRIPLSSGEELQQRIQAFNKANPNNGQGLLQFLNSSYNNTSFSVTADGNLFYTVSGKNFKIAPNGLTPRVALN